MEPRMPIRPTAILIIAALAGCAGSSARSDADSAAAPVGAVPRSRVAATAAPAAGRRDANLAKAVVPPVPAGQAPVPPLPSITLDTTETQLGVQALLAAREEVGADLAGKASVAQRHDLIFHTWLVQMRAEQARLATLGDQRAARERRMIAASAAQASRDREFQAVEQRYAVEIEREQRKTVPVLAAQ